jgi:hypothetical protein
VSAIVIGRQTGGFLRFCPGKLGRLPLGKPAPRGVLFLVGTDDPEGKEHFLVLCDAASMLTNALADPIVDCICFPEVRPLLFVSLFHGG